MLTDFLNELRRLKFLGVSRGMLSWEFCFDFNSLKSPFLGFWIIQTGYWQVPFSSGDWPCNLARFFFIKNVSVLWKIGPISVKRWKPVWIRAWNEYHSASRASFWAVQWEGKKEALWWLNPNFYTGQSCFLSSNCFFFFECQHPFIDDPFVTTEPAVGSARLLGLGPFSSPGPVVSWSRDLTI